MDKNKVVSAVKEELGFILPNLNLSLEDIEFKKEGGRWLLQVIIDKPGGVRLDDCEDVNRQLGDRLDVIDVIPDSYTLEVSSPGLERPLKTDSDFSRFAGEWVKIRCFVPVEGQKHFAGKLLGMEAGKVKVELENNKQVEIPRDMISKANLWFRFGQEG